MGNMGGISTEHTPIKETESEFLRETFILMRKQVVNMIQNPKLLIWNSLVGRNKAAKDSSRSFLLKYRNRSSCII